MIPPLAAGMSLKGSKPNTKTKAEIIADIEWLSAMLTNTINLPMKVKAQQTEITCLRKAHNELVEYYHKSESRISKLEATVRRLQRKAGKK